MCILVHHRGEAETDDGKHQPEDPQRHLGYGLGSRQYDSETVRHSHIRSVLV